LCRLMPWAAFLFSGPVCARFIARPSKAQTVEFFDVRDPVRLGDETSSFLHED